VKTLTVKEVADLLKLDYRRVYKLIKKGEIPGVKIGRSVRIPEESLRRRLGLLEAENERLRQIEAAARTLVDTAFEVPGPDEYVYQAVRVDHFDMLAALLKGEGGATHA